MNKQAITNKLLDEQARLQRRYNNVSKGLCNRDLDQKTIKSLLESISEQLVEVRRQLDLVGF